MVPFGRAWQVGVKSDDLAALGAYRRFLLVYYYLGIVLPVSLYFVALYLGFA